VLWRAMDHLKAGAGDAINRYATEPGVHLVPYNDISIGERSASFKRWRYRSKETLRGLKATLRSLTTKH